MESRQVRLLAALTALLACLVAALWLGERPSTPVDTDATSVISAGFEPADATSVVLERQAGQTDRVVMEKVDGMWTVTEPFQAPADLDRITAVLQTLGAIEKGVPVPGAPYDFGLETPTVVATVGLPDGERRLVFGNVAPVGHRSYMLDAAGSPVAVRGKPAEELLKRVGEYRDHRIFSYHPGDVVRTSIQSRQGTLEAIKGDAGWFLTGYGQANLDALDSWITELLTLRVDLFLDLEHDTIEEPLYRVEVETPAGVQVLLVGKDTPYGKLVFFGDGLDGVVDHALLQMLERGPSDVGVSTVFPFQATSDHAVVLTGAREATFTQSEGEWTLSAPELEALVEAQFVYKLQSPVLEAPELTVRFEGGDGVRVVEIGPVDAEGFRAVRRVPGGALRVPVEELTPLFGGSQ